MPEHSALNTILQPGGITAMYQPIVADDGSLAGFECLSRGPRGTNFEAANVMFDYVRLKREETLVDRACIVAALSGAPAAGDIRLALNVHASTLGRDHGFTDFVRETAERHGIACDRLTIEIVEHAPPWNSIGFSAALERLREAGMRIALDDVGLGQSNFKMILDVRPDYLKIDRYFVDECDHDHHRQAVLRAVSNLASDFGANVVAEGVETEAVRDVVRSLGIRYMQGYLFAPPLTAADARNYAAAAKAVA